MGARLSPESLQAGAVKGLSTIERDHHIDRWRDHHIDRWRDHHIDRWPLRGRICARPEISPESILYRTDVVLRMRLETEVPCMYGHAEIS